MNKQELIEEIKKANELYGNYERYARGSAERYNAVGQRDGIDKVLDLIDQLDEPELPVIPKFVADWIELAKDIGITLVGVMDLDTITIYKSYPKVEFQNLKKYMVNGNNQKRVARAWLDGYTIEKEKLYFVKEPITGQFLIRDKDLSNGVKWVDGFSTEPEYFTEKLIKAIDERYWSFATEVK